MGLLFFGTGLFIILVAIDIIPIDENDLNAPRWVLGMCGFVTSLAGIMVITGQSSKWNNLLAAVLIISMGTIGVWVALFSASENFSGGIPMLSETANISLSRWVFGIGAVICFAIAGYALKLFYKSNKG